MPWFFSENGKIIIANSYNVSMEKQAPNAVKLLFFVLVVCDYYTNKKEKCLLSLNICSFKPKNIFKGSYNGIFHGFTK